MIEELPLISRSTFVCADCVVDDALASLVSQMLSCNKCSYCTAASNRAIAAPFDAIMERIYAAVTTEYQDAQEVNTPWVEGGWLEEEILIEEIIENFDPGWRKNFLNDVISSFDPSIYWVEHTDGSWGLDNPSDSLRWGWRAFKDQVLTKTRYLFLNEPEDEYNSGRPDYIPIGEMLEILGGICEKEQFIYEVPAGTLFYRVRAAKKNCSFKLFSEMAAPPPGYSTVAGRMNPAGIPYFYIASDPETAEKEIISWAKWWCVAEFESLQPLRIVDFSTEVASPSIFEPALYERRHHIGFLKSFASEITKPTEKDGREHIDYVPTQIISEYFRYRFKDISGNGVHGIAYPSVKNHGGKNFAIFEAKNEALEKLFRLRSITNRAR